MNRWMVRAGTLMMAVGLAVWLRWGGRTSLAQSTYTVTWEAEDAAKIEEPFKKRTGERADKRPKPQTNSGAGWVEIPDKANGSKKEGEGTDLPGVARFKVNVPAAGAYIIWGRVLWPDGCGNSFWVLKEGRPRQVLGEDGTYDAWHWRPCSTKLPLTKGVNVIEVRNREDGVLLDQLQITTDTRRAPTGPIKPTAGALAN